MLLERDPVDMLNDIDTLIAVVKNRIEKGITQFGKGNISFGPTLEEPVELSLGLIPYLVGENDIVVAYSESEARDILIEHCCKGSVSGDCDTEIRVETLELDNRMRGLGMCGDNHVIICADVEE
jgi:hypothetical protein